MMEVASYAVTFSQKLWDFASSPPRG